MQELTLLDAVAIWARSLDGTMRKLGGELRLTVPTAGRSDNSCSVNLRREDREADLVVWESGEGELILGTGERAAQFH